MPVDPTYANPYPPHPWPPPPTIPKPGGPTDLWWIGFDCGHCDDLKPGMVALMREADPERYEALFAGQIYTTYEEAKGLTQGLAVYCLLCPGFGCIMPPG